MSELQQMVDTIDTFSKEDHIKILEIIYNYDKNTISENSNGCFIHMEDIPQNIIDKIQHYISYVGMKEGDINSIEETKDKLKNNIKVK